MSLPDPNVVREPEAETDLDRIRIELLEIYDEREIEVWLTSPQPQLDGARAIDLIEGGRAEEVLQIIRRLNDGAYL